MRGFRWIAIMIVCMVCAGNADGESGPAHPRDLTAANQLCENALKQEGMCDLAWAFAALWLDRDKAEANARLQSAYNAFLDDASEMTPAIADEKVKWQMRTWVRVYYLFNKDSTWFPGRLEAETQERIEELFWNYACAKSTVERARPEYVWLIQGSENHDMMDLGNAFLAIHAVAKLPQYADRELPDGKKPREHLDAWTAYYKLYCEERVKRGLFVEIASPTYGKYLVPELINIYDFAGDSALRSKLGVLLHVTWADWAIEQIDGVRGGAKTRCYQGNYSRLGGSDSWRMMGEVLLGEGEWSNAKRYAHPIMGFGFVLATTSYRLPPVIESLAHDTKGRGEYVYISRRPGRMTAPDALPSVGGHPCWYFMDNQDSRLVRYTWCTPDHIMGCFFADPVLTESIQVTPGRAEEARGRYAAISGQNRWQGIVFATGPDARIFPQCVGRPDKNKKDLSVTEIQHIAIQHRNVMIVQANRAEPRNTAMRIYFAPGMRDRLVTRSGWMFLEEGDSYAGIAALSRDGTICETSWEDGQFLRVSDLYAPIVFVTGRRARFESLDAFQQYVAGHKHTVRDGALRYRFNDLESRDVELSLFVDERRLPEKNGVALDLTPRKVFDSPFIESEFGSALVAVSHGTRRLTLNVDAGSAIEVDAPTEIHDSWRN